MKYSYVDKPSTKLKIHKKPIPLSGGISIVASILLALTLSNLAGFIPLKDTLFYLLYLIFPAMMILFIGLLDDRGLVQAKTRITAQAIFSLIPITTLFINLKIDNILDFTTLALLAILFIVGTIAAVNMSDGMDGLCGGLLLVTFAGMIFVNKLPSLNCFLIIIIISLIGFLFYNFNPAR
ncbi:MAG: hypothetical protein PHH45_01955, partial [Patescibacteria group bacterium]|nr:hypothetical protein [Patescibacteria group bacterium]